LAPRHEFEYVHNGTASIDVSTGRVAARDIARNDSVNFIDLLEEIDASIDESHSIHVVLDNGSSHTSRATGSWFATHSRFFVHHTPAHASWLAQP